MKKLLLTTAAAAAFAISASSFAGMPVAHTSISPWYVGVGANTSAVFTNQLRDSSGDTYKLDNRGYGANLFLGYRMSRMFGAEAGFNYLGSSDFKRGSSKIKLNNQWNLNLVGQMFMPVSQWFNPYIFAGVAYMNSSMTVSSSSIYQRFGGFGFIYGAGLAFNFNQFGARVSYTRQDPTNNTDFHTVALGSGTLSVPTTNDYISLDVLYRFGG